MTSISKAQAHMLAVTRLLGRVNHNSGFKGGIRTARVLAAKGLLELREVPKTGEWYGCIPAATLMNEVGMRWINGARQFIQMGKAWDVRLDTVPAIRAQYYSARQWHDGRAYFLVRHPVTNESTVVFATDLHIKEHDAE
jgi:hypothetical protein